MLPILIKVRLPFGNIHPSCNGIQGLCGRIHSRQKRRVYSTLFDLYFSKELLKISFNGPDNLKGSSISDHPCRSHHPSSHHPSSHHWQCRRSHNSGSGRCDVWWGWGWCKVPESERSSILKVMTNMIQHIPAEKRNSWDKSLSDFKGCGGSG